MQQARVWGAFVLLGTIWGSSFLFIKLALADLEPFTLVAIRLGIGMIGLSAIVALTRRRLPSDTSTLLKLVLVTAFNTAIPFTLITWGEKFIASGVAGLLNGTVPLFALVIAHFFLADERITWLRLVGLVVGFGGLILIFSSDLTSGFARMREGAHLGEAFGDVSGQLAVVLAAICYAMSAVYVRRNMRNVEPLILAVSTQVAAFVMVTIGALLFENPFAGTISRQTWFAVGWLGVLGVTVAYILYFFIISEWGATRASLVTYVLPVVAFVLGAIVLDEPITALLVIGGLMIIGGIALVSRKQASAEVTQSQPALEATS